jgi:hypothetical protein
MNSESLPEATAVLLPPAASSTVSQGTWPCPPYIRVVLDGRLGSAAMPDGLTGHLSRKDWQSFCNNVWCATPCLGTERLFRIARRVLVVAIGYVVLNCNAVADSDLSLFRLTGLMVLLVTGMRLTLRWIVAFTRKKELETLRTLCRAEEDRLFRSRGFVLECEFEWCDNFESSRSCVYFLPIPRNDDEAVPNTPLVSDAFHGVIEYRNGYKRIELFNDGSNSCCAWNPISFSYIPLSDESIAPESFEAYLWTRFWSELSAASKKILFDFRLSIVTGWLCIGTLLVGSAALDKFFDETTLLALLALFFSALALWLCSRCKLSSSIGHQHQKIQLYGAAFVQRSNVIIVDRNVYGFSNFAGLYHIRYLYVYRLSVPQAVSDGQVVTATVFPDIV